MKRIIAYIVVCMALTCCTDDFDESAGRYATLEPRYLKVSPVSFNIPSSKSTEKINVTSIQTSWKTENGVAWIALSPESGNSSAAIQISAEENTSGDQSRVGVFYVKSNTNDWKYDCPITVTQSAARPFILLSKYETDFPGTANTETITVTANCKWTAQSSEPWLTVTQQDNAFLIKAAANESETVRTATVYVSSNGSSHTSSELIVRQLPSSITASSEQLEFKNTAGSINVSITSETPWTAATSESWINVEPSGGEPGSSSILVSVSPNSSVKERTGYIFVSIGSYQRIIIPVKQKGIYIESTQSELSFASTPSKLNLQIKSNTDWAVSSLPSWITISSDKGNGDAALEVSAPDNPSIVDRRGTIHITNANLGIDISVSVTQKGKTFDVNTTLLNFDDKASSETIDIETDGTWNAVTNENWITLTPKTNSGKSVLTVGVTENTGDNERTGQVNVTMCDKTTTIFVTQKGKFFTISDESLSYTSIGGSINISITTNDSWTAKIEGGQSWLTLSKTNGSGNIDLTAVAADNPSVNSRSAAIVFETKYSQNVKVIVTQAARYFSIDAYDFKFYPKGGTSEVVTIKTDGKYKITCSDTWFSVTQNGNTFTVTATPNTTPNPRTGTVTVEVTDLKEGKLSAVMDIMQENGGSSIFRQDFDEDNNYDITINTSGDISRTVFGNDTNYDITVNKSGGVTKNGFDTDNNWD